VSGLAAHYQQMLAAGELRADAEQAAAVEVLARVQAALETPPPRSLFGRAKRVPAPAGVYLWGDVGRGKSMLMDAFYQTLELQAKRRVHFHAFMQEVHGALAAWRAKDPGDPIEKLAHALGCQLRCLCFDEMMVTNPADAMILSRLFAALLAKDVCVIATSNRPPHELYKDGINRALFLPFIALLEERLEVQALNGVHDYRLARLQGAACWFVPCGAAATAAVRKIFFRLTDYPPEDAAHVPSLELDMGGGRVLHVPKALKGVAVFSFKRLCQEARGAPDYLAIARHFHSVILVGIPQMGAEMRNEAARFITLIDTLYEHGVKLFATAQGEVDALYAAGDGVFEFARTASRLHEMQSQDYLARGYGTA
jgi:cell division protein ZapE